MQRCVHTCDGHDLEAIKRSWQELASCLQGVYTVVNMLCLVIESSSALAAMETGHYNHVVIYTILCSH